MEHQKNPGTSNIYNVAIPKTMKDEGLYCSTKYEEEGRNHFTLRFDKKDYHTDHNSADLKPSSSKLTTTNTLLPDNQSNNDWEIGLK